MPLNSGMYPVNSMSSDEENRRRLSFVKMFENSPIPPEQRLANLSLFLNSKSLARILFMDHLYQQTIDVMGVVMEFGTHWGTNLAQFSALRGIYEPFNRHKKLVGFDTFEGFPEIHPKDGDSDLMQVGHLNLPKDYIKYLEEILRFHEEENPISHIKKFELCKGDVSVELPRYLDRNPETVISLAYFDLDLYKPTKDCLMLIRERLVKGSVIGFDEVNDPDSPGETIALMEVFGLNNIELKRFRYASRCSYFVFR